MTNLFKSVSYTRFSTPWPFIIVCTVSSALSTLHSACPLYCLHCTVRVHCTVYTAQCVSTVLSTLHSVCPLYCLHCTVHVHCTVQHSAVQWLTVCVCIGDCPSVIEQNNCTNIFFSLTVMHLDIIRVFYLPTDTQESCFKRNIKIYIKTVPTSFGLITIIRERIIRAKVTVVKIIN